MADEEGAPEAEAPEAEPEAEAPSEPAPSEAEGEAEKPAPTASEPETQDEVGETSSAKTAQPEPSEASGGQQEAPAAEDASEAAGQQFEMPMGPNVVEITEKRILCVGQCFMGFALYCNVLTPENKTQRANQSNWTRSGNASNVATMLRLFDIPVEFFGVISNAVTFCFLLEDFRERGIYINHCPKSNFQPVMESVIVSQKTGSHTIVKSKTLMPSLTFEQFEALGDLGQFLWFHFEGTNIEETYKMMKYVRAYNDEHENRIKVSVSLEIRNKEVLKLAKYADFVIMGNQLARHMGWNEPETACRNLRKYLEKAEAELCSISVIIVPWSEKGCCFMDVDDSVYMMPAYHPIAINDTVGIGDVFIGALITAIFSQNKVARDAIDFANYVCSYKIAHRGFDAIKDMPEYK